VKCPVCDGELAEDHENDTSIVETSIAINNFVCVDCGRNFEIEYTPIDIREI